MHLSVGNSLGDNMRQHELRHDEGLLRDFSFRCRCCLFRSRLSADFWPRPSDIFCRSWMVGAHWASAQPAVFGHSEFWRSPPVFLKVSFGQFSGGVKCFYLGLQ